MAKENIIERIDKGVLFLDGAMGTELIKRGADTTGCTDYLNIKDPETVKSVHNAYLEAGSDAVITNTFGANAVALKRHGLDGKAAEINRAGAELARQCAGEDRYVIGDIGPCGDFIEPLGMVKADDLKRAFAEQAKALADGGADAIIIETMTAPDEIETALIAAKQACGLPVFVSAAYDPAGDEFKTMMGVSPVDLVEKFKDQGAAAIGFNCGTNDMAGYIKLAEIFASALKDVPVIMLAEPNAGKPGLEDGKAVYTLGPEDYAEAVRKIAEIGAKIIGGCCGTGPAHIEAAVKAVRGGLS